MMDWTFPLWKILREGILAQMDGSIFNSQPDLLCPTDQSDSLATGDNMGAMADLACLVSRLIFHPATCA